METKCKAKGSWGVRFFIVVLGITLGILFFWLLSFIEGDIGTMKGPEWEKVRRSYVSVELDEQKKKLNKEISELNRGIDSLLERKDNLYRGITNLQNTINQLLSIQKQYIEKNQEFPAESVNTLKESQTAFLGNQKEDLKFTQEIGVLIAQQQEKGLLLSEITETIEVHEKAAQEEYRALNEKHRLKVAILKLAFLVPVFLVMSFVFMKYRTSPYWPLAWAAFIAAFIKVAFVAHEYFPTEYFKYIALLVVIAIVLRILIYLIRLIVAPKKDLLIKQYQQFYDKHLCPVCTKPIKAGPLRYANWKKKATVLAAPGTEMDKQQAYTCPSCGTGLYDKCDQCGGIRHSLLPYCEHCGTEKTE